jgi:hypothetical protein
MWARQAGFKVDMTFDQGGVTMILVDRYDHRIYFCGGNNTEKK